MRRSLLCLDPKPFEFLSPVTRLFSISFHINPFLSTYSKTLSEKFLVNPDEGYGGSGQENSFCLQRRLRLAQRHSRQPNREKPQHISRVD